MASDATPSRLQKIMDRRVPLRLRLAVLAMTGVAIGRRD